MKLSTITLAASLAFTSSALAGPTEYCPMLGGLAEAVATDRDSGATKRQIIETILIEGQKISDRTLDDILTVVDMVYVLDLASPEELESIMISACEDTYGKAL